MKKSTLKWLVAALALILAGGAVIAAVTAFVDMDYSRLGTQKYISDKREITEDFDNILIKTGSTDVSFLPAEDGKCRVSCVEFEGLVHSISVQDGTLTVTENDTREFIDRISFAVASPTAGITVYLPRKEYGRLQVNDDNGDVIIPGGFTFSDITVSGRNGYVECCADAGNSIEIETYSGDIKLGGVRADSVSLTSYSGDTELKNVRCAGDCAANNDAGDVDAENVSCRNFFSNAFSGEASLKKVVAGAKMDVRRDSGDIRLRASDAGEIYLGTCSGSVSGTLLTEKVFVTETKSGDVRVPKTVKGGKCEIVTDWGDIGISLD